MKEDAGEQEEGDRQVYIPRGVTVEVICMGGGGVPLEENADLPDFTSDRMYLLLQEVYGDCPNHNDGLHLDGGVKNNAIWQSCWRRLAV